MKITKRDFLAYESVRMSGVTNMFAVNIVSQISCLTKDKIFYIMGKYYELRDKYIRVQN